MPLLMLQLNARGLQSLGKMSREQLVKDIRRLFVIWAEKSIFDERLTAGWMSTLTFDKENSVMMLISNGFNDGTDKET